MATPTWANIRSVTHSSLIVLNVLICADSGGSLFEAATVRAGLNFNHPLRIGHVNSSAAADEVSVVLQSIHFSASPNLVLETVKRGEDDDDVTSTPIKKRDTRNIILRIYEAYGGRGTGTISTYVDM